MAKSIGSTKTGGRKKGTPNRRTLVFADRLAVDGIDLLAEVLKIASELSEKDRLNAYLGLLPYQYPKRKPSDGPTLSLEEQIGQLSRDQMHQLWQQLGSKLGHSQTAFEMDETQLLEMRSTIDDLLRLKKLECDLGEPDSVL